MEYNSQEIVKELIINETGEKMVHKYYKMDILENSENNYYIFIDSSNNKKYIAKINSKNDLEKEGKQMLIDGLKIQKSCKHQNIATIHNYFEDEENIYILLDFYKNGTLDNILKKRERLTEIEVKYYIKQLIFALRYLHKLKIIHRNLKLSNIFLNANFELKLTGFNYSVKKLFDEEEFYHSCGTPLYMAPELLYKNKGYSYGIDIWALGIIIYVLIVGEFPFEANEVKTVHEKIKKNKYIFPKSLIISKVAKDLINKILINNPSKRLSLEQILNHDFFNNESIPSSLEIINIMQKEDYPGIEIKDNIKGPEIYIVKFLNYTSKYGIGYILTNGFCGVYFNDCTKIILNPYLDIFDYIKQNDDDMWNIISRYNLNNYPSHLQNKVILLRFFKDYLLKENVNIIKTNKINENDDKNEPYTYACNWKRIDNVYIFELTNKIFQFMFQDTTEIIISYNQKDNQKLLVYKDKYNKRSVIPLTKVFESSNKDLIAKAKYSKKLYPQIFNKEQEMKKIMEDIGLNYKLKQLKTFDSSENISEEEKINIEFTSMEQSIINFPIMCKINDNFIKIKNIILNNYPKLKERNLYFLANGGVIDELKTLKEKMIQLF